MRDGKLETTSKSFSHVLKEMSEPTGHKVHVASKLALIVIVITIMIVIHHGPSNFFGGWRT
jgi:hypothetical protein